MASNQPIQGRPGGERIIGREVQVTTPSGIDVTIRGRVKTPDGQGKALTEVSVAVNSAAAIASRVLEGGQIGAIKPIVDISEPTDDRGMAWVDRGNSRFGWSA